MNELDMLLEELQRKHEDHAGKLDDHHEVLHNHADHLEEHKTRLDDHEGVLHNHADVIEEIVEALEHAGITPRELVEQAEKELDDEDAGAEERKDEEKEESKEPEEESKESEKSESKDEDEKEDK